MSEKIKLYDITEAAEMLRVNPQTLRRWEKIGKINPLRISGGRRRYTIEDIEKLLHRNQEVS